MSESGKTFGARDVTISVRDRIERMAAELRRRWSDGHRVELETLPGYDVIADDSESLLDLIYHEVLIRQQF